MYMESYDNTFVVTRLSVVAWRETGTKKLVEGETQIYPSDNLSSDVS